MDRKYTDSDVRRDPSLMEIATRYVDSYEGNFDFLNGVKAVREANLPLGVTAIRGVLNCMLADSSVINMPKPQPVVFDASEGRAVRALPREIKRVKTQSGPIILKTRYKFENMISKRPNASLIHIVDPTEVYYKLWRSTEDRPRQGGDYYQPHIEWYCKKYLSIQPPGFVFGSRYMGVSDVEALELLAFGQTRRALEADVQQRKWKWCNSCVESARSRSNRSARRTST